MSEADFTRVSGDSGLLLFRHISILREPFTGIIAPPMSAPPPPPSYRAKRLSSSSTCSTTSLAHSVQSAPASLSSSSRSAEKISGEYIYFLVFIIIRIMEVMTHAQRLMQANYPQSNMKIIANLRHSFLLIAFVQTDKQFESHFPTKSCQKYLHK